MADAHRPTATSEVVRRRMSGTPRRDTPAELALRRELHSRGLRYRVDYSIPDVTRSRPDVVFTRAKVAVFVDGCFWHSCPEHASTPGANRAWWQAKLAANVARDRRHDAELEAADWTVLRFWEHEDPSQAAASVDRAVRAKITRAVD